MTQKLSPMVAVTFAALLAATLTGVDARQAPDAVGIDDDDIAGLVMSANGPEAGVWVIAETTGLPTGFRKDRRD